MNSKTIDEPEADEAGSAPPLRTSDLLASLVRQLFGKDHPSEETIEKYRAGLAKFGSEWITPKQAFGSKDYEWRYVQSMHAAGLLEYLQRPLIRGGRLVTMEHVYRRSPAFDDANT